MDPEAFYNQGKIGSLLPKLGEARMHPAVYAEIKRGDHTHNEKLRKVLEPRAWGEFDVIVTTEIPADRIVFVHDDAGVQMVVMLEDEETDKEMGEIMRLRRELIEALAEDANE